ncbi:MAG: hypothetical protein EXQ94_12075 [Alphaproteobacteria bacterium]|nr:hypothetical protein [Alphaproteobacteria bacterium]
MNRTSRRRFVATGLAAAGATQFRARIARAGDPIKVGAVLELSGGLELFGNQAKLGLDLAAKEINDGGGILGRPVEILYEDNKTDPKTAVERTTKLIQRDEVVAVAGPITSNARDAMAPAHQKFQTPLLYATNYEGGACDRNIFCFNTMPNQELAKLLPHMNANFGDSYYMFGADYVWPQKMFEHAQGIVSGLGGTTAGVEFTPWGVKEFAPVIRRVADSGAKVLVFALPGADGITFIRRPRISACSPMSPSRSSASPRPTWVPSARARARTCGSPCPWSRARTRPASRTSPAASRPTPTATWSSRTTS